MISQFIVSLLISLTTAQPPFLSGDSGFFTSTASFRKTGAADIILRETFGRQSLKEYDSIVQQNQVMVNARYGLCSYIEAGTGLSFFTRDGENQQGLFIKAKVPFLSMGRMISSLSPFIVFAKTEKPSVAAALDIDIVPFKNENLPAFLIGQSLKAGRKSGLNLLDYSILLSLQSKAFQPFLEFYTELHDGFDRSSMYNTRICSGLGTTFGIWRLRAAIEIPLDEYEKRNFDYRITGEISISFSTKRNPLGYITITVFDAKNEQPLAATVFVKGKEVQETHICIDGTCIVQDLPLGIYTLIIKHPEYKSIKLPLFVKEERISRIFKLQKVQEENGDNTPVEDKN